MWSPWGDFRWWKSDWPRKGGNRKVVVLLLNWNAIRKSGCAWRWQRMALLPPFRLQPNKKGICKSSIRTITSWQKNISQHCKKKGNTVLETTLIAGLFLIFFSASDESIFSYYLRIVAKFSVEQQQVEEMLFRYQAFLCWSIQKKSLLVGFLLL